MKIISLVAPYYCVVEHENQQQIIDYAQQLLADGDFEFSRGDHNFRHQRLKKTDCQTLLNWSPLTKIKTGLKPYASIFSTGPGHYYRAHKDGQNIRAALNYIIEVHDSCCVTSWYDDQIETHYQIDRLGGVSRELQNFQKQNHRAQCSQIFSQNQCVVFNTDIYHDFDNTSSANSRHVLTLRFSEPHDLHWHDIVQEFKNHAS